MEEMFPCGDEQQIKMMLYHQSQGVRRKQERELFKHIIKCPQCL